MVWILDTDHVSLFQRQDSAVIQRMQSTPIQLLGTTIVTYEEQVKGRLNVINRASNDATLMFAYKKLHQTLDFFADAQVFDFTEAAVEKYNQLLKQKIRVGTQDLRIAAIVLSIDGILATRNWKDFQRVPGLKIEDWSII
jgi:tRNA(fMet)-specific endonuclease VapC